MVGELAVGQVFSVSSDARSPTDGAHGLREMGNRLIGKKVCGEHASF